MPPIKQSKDLGLNHEIYRAYLDRISTARVTMVKDRTTDTMYVKTTETSGNIAIIRKDSFHIVDSWSNKWWFNRRDALVEQRKMRDLHINNLKSRVDEANKAYLDAIVKYTKIVDSDGNI